MEHHIQAPREKVTQTASNQNLKLIEPDIDKLQQTLKILRFTQRVAICCVVLNILQHYMSDMEGSPFQRGSYPFGTAIITYLLTWSLTNNNDNSWEIVTYLRPLVKEHVIFILNFSVIALMSEETILPQCNSLSNNSYHIGF